MGGVSAHMGSEVTETNCSAATGPCNDPAGGFISATPVNSTRSDLYTRTKPPRTLIGSINTAGCCRLGAIELTHTYTSTLQEGAKARNNFVKQIMLKEAEHNVTARVKCARAGQ